MARTMNPNRVDFLIDMAYGVLIFISIVLIVVVEMDIGVAFGVGALIAYMIHVGWKMARFDPDWMTQELAEDFEETLTTDMIDGVEEKVAKKVTESVEETFSEEMDTIADSLEDLDERIDPRPGQE